ncbi:MAG: sigma-70 family RNA polymerase sigma factor [Chloroflexi bacterium]|nr:sigma-70 family RNA polymerase sigma factor [Chloroflexota bacterium]
MYLEEKAIRLCQRGDRDEFRIIIELYNARLYKTALFTTHNPAAAQDTVQETFIKGWKRIRKFKPGTNLGAWLTRILVNYLIDEHRKRRIETVELEAAVNTPHPSGSASLPMLKDEESRMLLGLIVGLPIAQRVPLVMRYFHGMALADIAEETGWRPGTVKSRLNRGLTRLRGSFPPDSKRVQNRAEAPVRRMS